MSTRLLKSFILTALALSFFLAPKTTKACNLSDLVLDSVITGAGFSDIYVTVNAGAGVTGVARGAGGDTRNFIFSFYGSGTLAPISFTPSVTSDSTAAIYPGFNAGPGLGAVFNIAYIYGGTDFTCITSTALCGNVHTDTKQLTFRVNELPDSVRLHGIEGASNPFAGCYPDDDMVIDFTTLPVVWASFEARTVDAGVQVEWSTASEINNDRFEVMRSDDGFSYEVIGTVDAIGNTSSKSEYQIFDAHPAQGTNFYKVVQIDNDGKQSETEIVSIEYQLPGGLSWIGVGPNPLQSNLNLSFSIDESADLTLRLISLNGQLLRTERVSALPGSNQMSLDLSQFATGVYYLEIASAKAKISKKLMKI